MPIELPALLVEQLPAAALFVLYDTSSAKRRSATRRPGARPPKKGVDAP